MKTNAEIAAAFDELGDLYELDGAVSYRVIAYRTAAKSVRDASVSVMGLTREGKVTSLPGRKITTTPHNPTTVASQRRMPTFSPRKTIASAVTKIGATNVVAEASAIGR